MATPDMDVIKEIPGYKVILKAILKSQIQQLVEQLATTTEEESVILTASVTDGTLCHLGSDSGKSFLEDHEDFKSQFLGFCLKRHHRRKQEEDREKERQEAMRNIPTTPPRFAGPRHGFPGMPHRSPRFPSPRQSIHPVALTRVSPGMNVRGMRHEPYPMSRHKRPLSFDGKGQGQPSMKVPIGNVPSQAIKIEPDDPDDSQKNQAAETSESLSQPTSPSRSEANPKSEREEDARSSSSSSTLPNESTDLKYSDSAPPEGLSLDSDLSNLIPPVDSAGTDNQEPQSDPQTPGSSAGADPSVNVKVEALTESEMDLEITGVELGARTPAQEPMASQENWGQSMGASGSQEDLQMGYNMTSSYMESSSQTSDGMLQDAAILAARAGLLYRRRNIKSREDIECGICGLRLLSPCYVKIHMRVHTGEKPFECNLCLRKFKRKFDLKRHVLTTHRFKEQNQLQQTPEQLQQAQEEQLQEAKFHLEKLQQEQLQQAQQEQLHQTKFQLEKLQQPQQKQLQQTQEEQLQEAKFHLEKLQQEQLQQAQQEQLHQTKFHLEKLQHEQLQLAQQEQVHQTKFQLEKLQQPQEQLQQAHQKQLLQAKLQLAQIQQAQQQLEQQEQLQKAKLQLEQLQQEQLQQEQIKQAKIQLEQLKQAQQLEQQQSHKQQEQPQTGEEEKLQEPQQKQKDI